MFRFRGIPNNLHVPVSCYRCAVTRTGALICGYVAQLALRQHVVRRTPRCVGKVRTAGRSVLALLAPSTSHGRRGTTAAWGRPDPRTGRSAAQEGALGTGGVGGRSPHQRPYRSRNSPAEPGHPSRRKSASRVPHGIHSNPAHQHHRYRTVSPHTGTTFRRCSRPRPLDAARHAAAVDERLALRIRLFRDGGQARPEGADFVAAELAALAAEDRVVTEATSGRLTSRLMMALTRLLDGAPVTQVPAGELIAAELAAHPDAIARPGVRGARRA